MTSLGNVCILVQSGPRVDPNFHLMMPDPPFGWQKILFLLGNDADVPLSMFTGTRSVPQPNWGYGVAQTDLYRLQTMWEVVQRLLQGGLMGTRVLWTFFRCDVQPHGCI
jgi:hypothetical protein